MSHRTKLRAVGCRDAVTVVALAAVLLAASASASGAPSGQRANSPPAARSGFAADLANARAAAALRLALLDQLGRDGLGVRIEVEASDGVLSLRGSLADDDHREIALRTARSMPGARKVLDLLRVR